MTLKAKVSSYSFYQKEKQNIKNIHVQIKLTKCLYADQ